MKPMKMLTISCLTKTYPGVLALAEVSLSVAPGERVALLGHNGAGKSTLMKIVLGLIPFDGGSIQVAGFAPGSAGARAQVAYLPENVAFHPALTGLEQIRHYLTLRGADATQALPLLARVGLADAARRRIGTYSKGMRQRVGLAQALIGHPKLMILDEPTSGLDPIGAAAFDELIATLGNALGLTVFLVTHDLDSLYAICDRVAVLADGKMVIADRVEVVEQHPHPWIRGCFQGPRARGAQGHRAATPAAAT